MLKNISKKFDVIVVGAGPAGAECARGLSKRGRKVLLMEKSQEIGQPNFSSGGTPLETFRNFDLPKDLGRGAWSKILIAAFGNSKIWDYGKARGYVFDFSKLKKFLAGEAIKNGAHILVGTSAEEPIMENGAVAGVAYRGVFGAGEAFARVVIDASGPSGILASKVGLRKDAPCSASTGIEIIAENAPVELEDTLAFYFSDYYVPCGYGWIFPFGKNSVKVGVAVYEARERGGADMMGFLKKFMSRFPQLKNIQPIDLHGGSIYINGGMKKHSQNGFLVIGDAAMQINPLAGEGVRHALYSGKKAAEIADMALSKNDCSEKMLKHYDTIWQKYVGAKWKQSLMISEKIYGKLSEKWWKYIMKMVSGLSPDEVFEAGFNYHFLKVIKKLKIRELLHKTVRKDAG